MQAPGAAGDALPAGRRTTAATWARGCTPIRIYQDFQKKAEPLAEVLCRRLVAGLGQRRQPDRARRGRDGLGQLLHDARREAGGRPRLQLAGGRPGLPGPSGRRARATTTGSAASRAIPSVVGKKILVNNYPMTIVGVSAAGFAGIDPAQSPQIRVPILMKPVDGAGVGLGAHGRPPRALGAGVRAAEARLHRRIGAGAAAGAVHADPRSTR